MTASQRIDLDYASVQRHVSGWVAKGRSESSAFLIWFLENVYRLDEFSAEDAICDGRHDKGIDGIYVDEHNERVDVFQSKISMNDHRSLGDRELREFAGSLSQFSSGDSIRELERQTVNGDLLRLLQETEVARRVEEGYEVRGVFVTNSGRDSNADEFLKHNDQIKLFDQTLIQQAYVPPGDFGVMHGARRLSVDLGQYSADNSSSAPVYFVPVRATELVKLQGIESGALFAWNVRQSLGRTKVNKDISQSILEPSRHQDFLLFHNGLTILAQAVHEGSDGLTIDGYTVVNGCQSLSSMYDYRDQLTDQLRVLTRIIQIDPDAELAGDITHHSNNQNPINARDLQSNSSTQRRLQEEFRSQFGSKVHFQIKRGERTEFATQIDNELAARIMLAFDLQEPWSCHQTYRLFDELHPRIFNRPEVTARRVLALFAVYSAVASKVDEVAYESMGKYRLTIYFLLDLMRRVMEQADEIGAKFCEVPDDFVDSDGSIDGIRIAAESVLNDLLIDVNAEVEDRAENEGYFDYKRILKSQNAVTDLARDIVPQYLKGVKRNRAISFGEACDLPPLFGPLIMRIQLHPSARMTR